MIFIYFIVVVIGFIMLIKGADFLVDGASSLAKKFKVSELVIGLTIVAFGTSAPELIVNILASLGDHHEITFGNIIGSNVFNILVVLGIAGLIAPIVVKKNTVIKEMPFLLISTIVVFGLSWLGQSLSRIDGFILLGILASFFIYIFGILKENPLEGDDIKIFSTIQTIFLISIGMMGLFIGGTLVVDNSVKIAKMLNVSEKLIGLTIVALGTSLPELVTSVVAVRKKRFDLAIGNVIGSNIFNSLLVLGVTSLIQPIKYFPALNVDFSILLIVTIILFFSMFVGKKHRIYKSEATFFLLIYGGFLFYLIRRG
ncbi:MAG: calcium/sodium antiporter [Candidatus Cloacimonetes bacterium]|nr:calcium/sodium antiporter [Candidatus Cloacimonadota bacterium]